MSGLTAGQRQVRGLTQDSVHTLQQGQADLLSNPNFLIGQQRGVELGMNPFTWDPTTIQNAKNAATESAYNAFGGQMNQINEGATAGQGFRSGTTNMQKRYAAQGLGSSIANSNRAIDTQAAMARPEDLLRAIGAQGPIIQQGSQFTRDISNAYLGASSNPIWQQPSTAQSVGGGLGGLAGIALGQGLQSGGPYSQPGFLRK